MILYYCPPRRPPLGPLLSPRGKGLDLMELGNQSLCYTEFLYKDEKMIE